MIATPVGPAARTPRHSATATRPALPGSHLGLSWRALGSADVDDVVALHVRSDAVDSPSTRTTREDVEELLAAGGADTLGGHDVDGILRAVAALEVREVDGADEVHLRATVDPGTRGRGIGKALLAWQDDRARDLLAERPRGASVIVVHVDDHQSDRRRLYAAAGFTPVASTGPRTRFEVRL